jgi:uncharacterized protein (DUF2267 family)
MTVEAVARELLCSPTKISRAEAGVRRATLRDVRDLCRIYEADPATSAELMELARDSYQQGWWNKYDDLKITPLIGVERQQKVFDGPRPPKHRVVLDEAVLRRHIGAPAVMRAQLEQVLTAMRDDRTTVQVIPYTAGAYGANDSNFTYMEFAGTQLPNLVFVETLVSQLYIERPDEVERYSEALDYLRDAALNPRDSAKKIEEIRDEF